VTPTKITRNNWSTNMTTLELTPTQHAILEHAIEHTSGVIDWFPDNVKGGARQKAINGLFNRALITPDGAHWFVAAEGYDALGLARPAPQLPDTQDLPATPTTVAQDAPKCVAAATPLPPAIEADVATCEAQWTKPAGEPLSSTPTKPRTREHSKQAQVIGMLQRPEGATIAQICEATQWQAHTVRGTFAGAFKKKLGLNIVSEKPKGGERAYRIA